MLLTKVMALPYTRNRLTEMRGKGEWAVRQSKAKTVALTGLLFALAIALSWMESFIAPLIGLIPALKLGLSNIVVMYALLFLSKRTALLLVLLKALFAFLTRGIVAGILSACGGLVSFGVFCLLLQPWFSVSGYLFCVCGALGHNIGQLLAASVVLSNAMALAYAPVLMVAGIVVGWLSCVLTQSLFTSLSKSGIIKQTGKNPFSQK